MAEVVLYTGQPPAVHAGVNAMVCELNPTVANSAGDTLVIGKLPHRARLIDAVFYSTLATAGHVLRFGTSASPALFFGTLTFSTTVVARASTVLAAAQDISLSDDAMPRYVKVICESTTVMSPGNNGRLVITYRMRSS